VAIYSQMIVRRYAAQLDEQGLQFLNFVVDGARRMDALVNDLLAFTRVGAMDDGHGKEQTEAIEALQSALLNLASAIKEHQAEISYDPLPVLPMRKVHLEQLFQNLLGNSIKYRSAERPHIHIAAEQKESSWVIAVKDNGIGVEAGYSERIFGIFKRLHREEEYPGTGMGLAICQRIVERYHGRIWVESEYGHGATFFFAIPE
jgi:chemotaxis family two-component system sensor kinase Cph1